MLPFKKTDIIIFGSATLIAHGVDIKNNDLDVIVRPHILKEHTTFNKFIRNEDGKYKMYGDIELFEDLPMINKTFNQLNSKADIIEGYTFICLIDLRNMYCAMNRDKDIIKIKIIDKLLSK